MSTRGRPAAAAGLGLLVCAALLVPEAAGACGSCFLESEFTRRAYYATTLLMIAVPLLLAGGIVAWLRSAARRSAQPRDRASGGRARSARGASHPSGA